MHVDDVVANVDAGVGVGLQVQYQVTLSSRPLFEANTRVPFTVGQIHLMLGLG